MASVSDQNPPCPNVEEIDKELLEIICKVMSIADAIKIATVRVKGGARCTCNGDQTREDVPLKETAEELARAVSKLNEEVLKHALEGQGVYRKRKGRENARDSAYESRNSTSFEYPLQETGEDEKNTSEDC